MYIREVSPVRAITSSILVIKKRKLHEIYHRQVCKASTKVIILMKRNLPRTNGTTNMHIDSDVFVHNYA